MERKLRAAVTKPKGPSPHARKFAERARTWKFIAAKLYGRAQHTSVGRNERCPCGSGRKYKNCCGK